MLLSRHNQRRVVVAGVTGALGAAAWWAYNYWAEEKKATDGAGDEKGQRSELEQGLHELDATCTKWETALNDAIAQGDVLKANRIRAILRRAYGTIEAFNSSFGAGQGLGADPRRIRRITGGHGHNDDDGGSTASFISATSSFLEQDLSEFAEENGLHVTMNTSASGIAMSSTPSRPGAETPFGVDATVVAPPSPIVPGGGDGGGAADQVASKDASIDIWDEGQRLARAGKVLTRKCRANYCKAEPGNDFLARLHCFRQALDIVCAKPDQIGCIKANFIQNVSALIVMDNEDPQAFVESVEKMGAFCTAEAARDGGKSIYDEIAARGIPQMSLYDTAFEFVIFDSLDDLASPPQAVMNVLQSSWVPGAIKYKSVRTIIWAALKSRRALLKDKGYMWHFYDICLHLSPPLALGALEIGSESTVSVTKKMMDTVLLWIQDCFAIPGQTRGMSTEEYADKCMARFKVRMREITQFITPLMEK